MTTYEEMVYMVLDELKARSNDFYYNENHIIFLLDKYRAFLLKQKYSDIKKQIPQSNYQIYVINAVKEFIIPDILNISIPKLHYNEDIYNYIFPNRFKFVGYSAYNNKSKYFTIHDNTVLIKQGNTSSNIVNYKIEAVFESPKQVYELQNKEVLKERFPLEESLISPLLEMVVKDLTSAMFKPEDNVNNGKDDLGDLNKYMYQNSKSDLQKQIYG